MTGGSRTTQVPLAGEEPGERATAASQPRWDAAELTAVCSILGRKWTPTLLVVLSHEPMRHGDLCRRLSGVHRKVLHESLNGLIRDGLVERIIGLDEVGGVAVMYGLTALGESIGVVFDCLQGWCDSNLDAMRTSQAEEAIPLQIGLEPGSVTSR